MTTEDKELESLITTSNSFEKKALDTIEENEALKAQLLKANSILIKNLEWVRCGIGGNCSGYPQDHQDYIDHSDYLRGINERSNVR